MTYGLPIVGMPEDPLLGMVVQLAKLVGALGEAKGWGLNLSS